MNHELYHKFLVIIPEEKYIVRNCPEVEQYIYQTIVSKPCPELLDTLEEIIGREKIYGIITRGSLAQFLFRHKVKTPIFQLEFDVFNIMDCFRQVGERGYRRIALIEMSYSMEEDQEMPRRTEAAIGDFHCVYYRLYDNKGLENLVQLLKEEGTEFIVGDVEPMAVAEKAGIPNSLFVIDENSYRSAIIKTILATTSKITEEAKRDFIGDFVNLVAEAIFVLSEDGLILQHNQKAEKLFFGKGIYINVEDIFGRGMGELRELPANSMLAADGGRYRFNLISIMINKENRYIMIINEIDDGEELDAAEMGKNRQRGLTAKMHFEDMIARDEKMAEVIQRARIYARSSATIMICGATGTGKEILASSIHNESLRADGPFVAVNCATLTESLIESELFGYEKGTFTGALASGKRGLFELADKGTLFLDEVAELPYSMQAKLLRALQEKEIRRVGGEAMIPVDVRLIVATNRNLCRMIEGGDFREDLYYRLSVLELVIPPLQERPKDIVPMFKTFLQEAVEKENKVLFWEDEGIFQELLLYNWPGNVRELKNFAEQIVLLSEKYKLTADFIHDMIQQKHRIGPKKEFELPLTNDFKTLEAQYIHYLLNYFGGDKEKLCEYLNISRTTLWRKLGGGAQITTKK